MMGKEEKERGEFELNLELSIGYGKTEDCCKGLEENGEISRSNFSENNDNVCESVDLQTRRREIQALRRQEARRKREERIKKSRGQSGGVFVEDKLFLEAQKLQARAEERESRERDCVWEERDRKKDKSCGNEEEVGGELLSLSLFTDNKMQQQQTDYCLYPKVQQQQHRNGFQYSCGVWAYSSADCDSEHSNGVNDPANGNRSLEQCSSAVSDYHSMSHKGGSSSDTGSHSNSGIPRNLESHDSWSQAETDQVIGAVKLNATSNPHFNLRNSVGISKLESSLDQTRSENPSRETSGSLNDKSPKQATNDNINVAAPIPKMPCVSTTGNGPNGRTITGCLYKYTKMEVSIMCFCHGSSFSPAGFVEHAGGIDIAQPLKHITIVNPR